MVVYLHQLFSTRVTRVLSNIDKDQLTLLALVAWLTVWLRSSFALAPVSLNCRKSKGSRKQSSDIVAQENFSPFSALWFVNEIRGTAWNGMGNGSDLCFLLTLNPTSASRHYTSWPGNLADWLWALCVCVGMCVYMWSCLARRRRCRYGLWQGELSDRKPGTFVYVYISVGIG